MGINASQARSLGSNPLVSLGGYLELLGPTMPRILDFSQTTLSTELERKVNKIDCKRLYSFFLRVARRLIDRIRINLWLCNFLIVLLAILLSADCSLAIYLSESILVTDLNCSTPLTGVCR
jgi:hypothetical protein